MRFISCRWQFAQSGTVCQPICHWSCQWRRMFNSFCVHIFALCTVVNIFTVFRMCTLVLCAKFAHFAPCKAKPLIISKEDVDIYLSLAFCSFGFLSCQSLHSLQSEYIGLCTKFAHFAMCKAPCARQCHWSSGRDEIAPRLHPRLTGQHLYQACTIAQVANWRVICFWAPSMHRGTSESR